MKHVDLEPIWKETRKGTALVSFSRGSRPARRLILHCRLSLLMDRPWIDQFLAIDSSWVRDISRIAWRHGDSVAVAEHLLSPASVISTLLT
jgi:hypothetical protein